MKKIYGIWETTSNQRTNLIFRVRLDRLHHKNESTRCYVVEIRKKFLNRLHAICLTFKRYLRITLHGNVAEVDGKHKLNSLMKDMFVI